MKHLNLAWLNWTSRDIEILETLSLKVRVLSTAQVAQTWWPESRYSESDAKKRLQRLTKAGYVQRYQVNTHRLLEMTGPVKSWKPGAEVPDFPAIAWKLKKRWTEAYIPTWVYVASKRTANLFGANGGRMKDPAQTTHDLHLGEVYLRCRRERPRIAAAWLGEDAMPMAGYGVKDPDAFIMRRKNEVAAVIEFGGKYSASRIEDFHHHCQTRELQYELW